jgi:hypothetical protein
MAIKRPDIYEHNNPNLPIADSDFVKGGLRSAVQNLNDLYALTGKAGQLKQHSTQIYVSGENKIYLLKDANNVGNVSGWEEFNFGGGTNVVYTTGNQTISGNKNFLSRPTFNSTGLLIPSDLENISIQISGLVEISGDVVYLTGNQTISGVKNFSSRPTVNGTGVLLSGEAAQADLSSTVRTTGNQTISGVKSFENSLVLSDNLLYLSQASGQISGAGYTGYYDGGQFLGKTKLTQNNTRLINVGTTWVARDSNRDWNSVAMSSDGKYQTAVVYDGGQIYVSNDYGTTWAARDSNRGWYSVAISSDGKYQTAVVLGGQIYVSTDYGTTWAARDSGRNWYSVAMSSDGKYQTAVVSNGQIYVSTDYGTTWTARDSNRDWYSVAMSSDGKYQTAVVVNGQIYVSTNYGTTWVARDSNRGWISVAISSDGKYQTAVDFNGRIYVSADYGTTWAARDSNRNWISVAMSSDGKYQTAVDFNGRIYVSNDYGTTWVARDSIRNWISVAMSSDGKYQTAVDDNGQIYVSVADEFIDGSFTADNIYGNNLVYNTGNQTISGEKTFASTLNLINPLPIVIPSRNGEKSCLLGNDIADIDDFGTIIFIESGLSGLSSIYRAGFANTYGYGIVFGSLRGSGSNSAARKGYLTVATKLRPTGLDDATLVWTDRILSGQWRTNQRLLVNGTGVLLSGDIAQADLSSTVRTTGNQTVSGVKAFVSRPTVNGTGVLLSGEAVRSNGTVNSMIKLTQAQYNALSPVDPTTFYVIIG